MNKMSNIDSSERSVDNSPSLHSGEFSIAYHFPELAKENGVSPSLRSGENLHSSNVRQFSNLDSIVKSVINSFIERSRIGLQKYGTDLDRTDLDFLDWVKHAQEEHMDAILYLEKLKQMHISRGECNEGEFNVLAETESESIH